MAEVRYRGSTENINCCNSLPATRGRNPIGSLSFQARQWGEWNAMFGNTATICLSTAQLIPAIRASKSQIKLPNSRRRRESQGFPRNSEEEEDNKLIVSGNQVAKESIISSTSNPFVKHCVKLRLSSSYRHSHGSALLVGSTPILEICNFYDIKQELPDLISCLFLLDKAKVPQGLDDLPISTVRVSSTVMKKLSGLQSPDSLDAIALMKISLTFCSLDGSSREEYCSNWVPCPQRILVLDGIQDPGNLGTLLRSALAFGWGGIFLLPGCCDPFNEKALRASRGASFQIPIISGSWTHLQALRDKYHLKVLAGHPEKNEENKQVLRLTQEVADSLMETPLCLVLGSEGSGLSQETRQVCELVSIPMAGEFESLNVSVAGGIFLYMLQTPKPKL